MKCALLFLSILLTFILPAVEPIAVDLRGLSGSGTTNGWTYVDIPKPYADNATKFNLGSIITSPTFPGIDICSITVTLRCSSTKPARQLQVTFLHDGVPVAKPHNFACVKQEEKAEDMTIAVESGLHANGLVLSLQGSGNTGVWGVYEMTVDAVGSIRPYGLRTAHVGSTTFSAAWENSSAVQSNELAVVQTNGVPFSATYVDYHGFDEVENTGGNPKEISENPPSSFRGECIYAPARTSGIVQIGTGDKRGWLCFPCPSEAQQPRHLVLRAKRYVAKDVGRIMPVRSISAAGTNDLATVMLTDDMKDYAIPLPNLPAESEILLSSSTDYADGRVLVDAIGFATSVIPEHIATNWVVRVPVREATYCRVGGLQPSTNYLWSVRGFNDTETSPFPAFVPFETKPPTGLVVVIR